MNRWSDCGCDSCLSWVNDGSEYKLHFVVKEPLLGRLVLLVWLFFSKQNLHIVLLPLPFSMMFTIRIEVQLCNYIYVLSYYYLMTTFMFLCTFLCDWFLLSIGV